MILPPKARNHEIIILSAEGPFSTELIKDKIFGFGKIQISITLKITNEEIVIGQVKALVIGPFIIILKKIIPITIFPSPQISHNPVWNWRPSGAISSTVRCLPVF